MQASLPPLPLADVLLHCGDLTGRGTLAQLAAAAAWLKAQPHPLKIVICGNHDIGADEEERYCNLRAPGIAQARAERAAALALFTDASAVAAGLVLLRGGASPTVLTPGGFRVWGSPLTPLVWGAFQGGDAARAAEWGAAPPGLDLLLSHGPPRGLLDEVLRVDRETNAPYKKHVGCAHLLAALQREATRPAAVVCGHIHEQFGACEVPGGGRACLLLNVATSNTDHELAHPPVEFALEAEGAAGVARVVVAAPALGALLAWPRAQPDKGVMDNLRSTACARGTLLHDCPIWPPAAGGGGGGGVLSSGANGGENENCIE